MKTLALDLGTHTGWALQIPDYPVVAGVWNLKGGRFEGGGMRFVRLQSQLDEIHRLNTLDRVYFEEVRRHLGTDAAHVYGGCLAVVTAFCERIKIPYAGIPVGTIKKFATGKGNADKALMLEAARRKWPKLNVQDDNMADALWILECALAQNIL